MITRYSYTISKKPTKLLQLHVCVYALWYKTVAKSGGTSPQVRKANAVQNENTQYWEKIVLFSVQICNSWLRGPIKGGLTWVIGDLLL